MAKKQLTRKTEPREIVGMYELLDAVAAAIEAAPVEKRKALSDVLNAYADDFPEEFFWATGPQAPTLLHHLMQAIDCEPALCSECADKMLNVTTQTAGEA